MSTLPKTASTQPPPSDVVLLLRADAEQSWLNREVIPVLRQIEHREPLPSDQVGAALAYLEGSWNEAMLRARQTDAAHDLNVRESGRTQLGERAERYHTAVRALRGLVAERVSAFVETAGSPEPECARIA